jgi:WD40 repeat protein
LATGCPRFNHTAKAASVNDFAFRVRSRDGSRAKSIREGQEVDEESRFEELLSMWEGQLAQGRDVPAGELCADRPELRAELERRIGRLRKLGRLVQHVNSPGSITTLPPQPDSASAGEQTAPAHVGTAADLSLGAAPPGYEFLGELGRGGMGVVYKARHLQLDRVVALKMILSGGHASSEELARFKDEARAIARLQHPNIVQVHDVGEQGGLPYFSLEYCPGGSLDKKLAGTPLPPKEAAALVKTLAQAMQAAHEKGIVHRDLKPANVLLAADGTAKVTDFGLAKKLEEAGRTATGSVLGTPSYMAPEQAGGQKGRIGPATDVYALGAILYECLAGRPPFKAATPLDTLMQVVGEEPVSVRQLQPQVPKDLETICQKCLHKEPPKRYASARTLAEDLRRFLAGEPVRARPVGAAQRAIKWIRRRPAIATAVGVAAVAVVCLLAGALWHTARLGQEKDRLIDARDLADRRRKEADNNLYHALVREAQALRRARDEGYRDAVWDRLGKALRIDTPDRDLTVLRQEAVSCLGDFVGLNPIIWDDFPANVQAIALSPDGRLLAAALDDASVVVREVAEGSTLTRIKQQATSLAFLDDGTGLAIVSANEVKVWQVSTGSEWHCVQSFATEPQTTLTACNGKQVATWSGEKEGTISVWSLWDGRLQTQLSAGGGPLRSLLLTPDGELLAAVAGAESEAQERFDGSILVWHLPDGTLKHSLKDLASRPYALSPDGRFLALSQGGEGLVLHDLRERRSRPLIRSDQVMGACFTPDSQSLVFTTNWGGGVKVWSVAGHREIAALRGQSKDSNPTLSGNDSVLATLTRATAEGGSSVRLWRRHMPEKVVLSVQDSGIPALAFSPDGKWLVSGDKAGRAVVWDAATGQKRMVLPPNHRGPLQDVAFSPDGRLLACAEYYKGVAVWDAARWQKEAEVSLAGCHQVTFTPDGKHLAACGEGLAIWEVKRGQAGTGRPESVTLESTIHPSGDSLARALCIGPDGRRLAWGGLSPVRLWDIQLGEEIPFAGPMSLKGYHGLAFYPDGRQLAYVSVAKQVEVWDVVARQKLRVLGQLGEFLSGELAISPNGRWLAANPRPAVVTLWDAQDGRRLFDLPEATGPIWNLTWAPDGQRLAVGSATGEIVIWDLAVVETELARLGLNWVDDPGTR